MRLALVLVLTGCPDPHPATIDAPPPVPDGPAVDGGPCGADVLATGEIVDWDSTDASFCGVFGATFQVHGDATRHATTAPNGRFKLCIAPAPTTRIDITPPSAASQCTVPSSSYTVPGILVADRAVLASGALISARAFTVMRAPAFGYDATKAQVFVHVEGTPRAVSVTGTHDAPQAFTGAWAAGDTGANVFFPNVDPAPGSTTIAVAGGATGAGAAPLAAGTFTYVTVVTM
jgi:hypothetical protein